MLCNMKVHYGVHKSLPLAHLLSHIKPVHASHPISLRSILIIFSHLCLSLPTGSFLQVSPPKSCKNLSPTLYASHAPPISFSLIWSTTVYLVKNTNHEVHNYSKFSSLLLLPLRHKYPPHHLHITLFWNILSLCFTLNMREWISHTKEDATL
jgi:hypothetical protein